MRRQPLLGDVRVRFLPLRSGGERGAELWTAACGERPAQCFPLLLGCVNTPVAFARCPDCARCVEHADRAGELSEELWRAVARHGFDPRRCVSRCGRIGPSGSLRRCGRAPAAIGRMPEVLVNDRRVVGAQLELRVMDEIDAARLRAHDMLKNGTPLTRLYEQLQTTLMTIGDAWT